MADKSLNLGTLFTADASQFFATINKMKSSLKTLNTAYAQTGRAAKTGLGGISTSVTKTNKAFDKGGKKAQEYSKQIGKVTGAFKRTVAAMKVTASYGIAATAIFAVTNAFKAGIKEIVDYDQALKNLQAITRATDAEVVGMGDTIKQVAETTKFSTGEVADGMVLLGQAGFDSSESMNAMQAVADLATGTLGDMKTVTDLLTTTIRAFNLDTIESSRVADVMSNAINRSKLTIDKLRIAFNFVGAAAAQSGLSIEEVAASMMLLANNGLRASTIGTGMRQVLARLLAPNRRLREEFEAQGISLDKINPRTVGYQNAMKELTKVLYDAETQTVDMGKAYQLFGKRGAQAVAVLVRGFAGTGFQDMLDKTYEVGSASTMAAKQMEGLAVAFKNLADRAKLLFIALGEGGLTHTLKVFVQTLKLATIAIAAFLKSGVGQLIISVGSLTGSIYLVGKGIVFLTARLGFLTKAFITLKTITAASLVSFVSWTGATETSTKAARTLRHAITRLYIVMLRHPFMAVALAIGAVVAVINHFLGSTQRAIDATMKLTQESSNHIQVLRVYSKQLEKIAKKKAKGEKIDKEYLAVLQRLVKAYPKLKKEIKYTTDAIEENAEVVKRFLGKEIQKNIKETTELIALFAKGAEEARIKEGLWQELMPKWEVYVSMLGRVFDLFFGTVVRGWEWVFDKMQKVANFLGIGGEFAGSLKTLRGFFAGLMKDTKDYFAASGAMNEEAIKFDEQRMEALEKLAKTLKENNMEAKEIIKTLVDIGAKNEEIEKITNAFVEQEKAIKKANERSKEAVIDNEHIYKGLYDSLDTLRKNDLLKAIKAMDAEIAAARKKHKELGDVAELGEDVIAAIRTKHLLKLEEDSFKEILSAEEISRRKVEVVERETERVKELYDEKTIEIHNRYQRELEAAQGNKEKIIEAEKKFNKDIEAQAKLRTDAVEGIQAEHNKHVLAEQKRVVDEMRKLHVKMAEDLISNLKDKYKDLKNEVKTLMDDLSSLDEEYRDKMRSLNQQTMTEEYKWQDDKAEYHRLMNEARATGDDEYYKKAMDMAYGLSREVKDADGKIIQSNESTQKVAKELYTKAYEERKELIKKNVEDKKAEALSIMDSLLKVEIALDNYKEAIGKANEEELRLELTETLDSLGEAHDLIGDFKTEWDALKSKTITLTVIVDKPSGTTTEGSDSSSEPAAETKKEGGLIQRLARGMKLPGFGGGDKIKALLEAGEWVIRKEAVQKYGSGLFEALNNLSFDVQDLLGGVMRKMGGMIPQPAVAKFQSGGEVEGGSGTGNNYYITLAPQFMTGDEMAVRNIVPELKRALDDLDHRWGE